MRSAAYCAKYSNILGGLRAAAAHNAWSRRDSMAAKRDYNNKSNNADTNRSADESSGKEYQYVKNI